VCYGVPWAARVCCKVDHLISLELGGASDEANLCPQPFGLRPGAYEKDVIEDRLRREVCAGRMTLAGAQRQWPVGGWSCIGERRTEHRCSSVSTSGFAASQSDPGDGRYETLYAGFRRRRRTRGWRWH
jgi:hypothetical protein